MSAWIDRLITDGVTSVPDDEVRRKPLSPALRSAGLFQDGPHYVISRTKEIGLLHEKQTLDKLKTSSLISQFGCLSGEVAVDSKPSASSRFATFYYFIGLIVTCAGTVGWLFATLGVKDQHGTVIFVALVASFGAILPAAGMLTWWLSQAIRERERAEEALSKLQRQFDETMPIRYAGIS